MYTRGDVFDDAAKKRNFDYYYPLTVRDRRCRRVARRQSWPPKWAIWNWPTT